ncbi:hypothetical protein DL769_006306 [Monosporascus sp. CRB-8-3]|nr:hypothetical protein DL769_006306 [Monosporascus sp. CRB-8-3]
MDSNMDNQWILRALQGVLPEQTLQLLHEHVLSPNTPLQLLYRQAASLARRAYWALGPALEPLVDRALLAIQNSPDAVVLVFVLTVLVVAVQVVFAIQRTMMWVTRLALRLVGWAVVAALIAVAWRRGPEATVRDLVVVVSKIVGYATAVKDIWVSEYERYDAQTRGASLAGQRATATAGYGRARGGRW